MGVCKGIVMGRLTADPELKRIDDGKVCNFDLACNKTWYNKEGEKKEKTTFIPISVWGKQAESCEKYLSKGSEVYVEGDINTKKSEVDGVTKVFWSVRAQVVNFLGSGDSAEKPVGTQESFSDPGAF